MAVLALAARAGPANAGVALFDQTTDTIQVAGQTIIGTASTYEAQIKFTAEHRGNGFVWNEIRIFEEDKLRQVGPTEVRGFNHLGVSPVFVGQATLDLDQWHHIAYVYDGAQERLYLDGLLLASRAESGDVGDSDGSHTVGAVFRGGGIVPSFVGFIDALRISDIARYSGASFTAPVGDFASDAGTLLLYNFNEPPGTTVIDDLSGNGHTGMLGAGFTAATPPTFVPEPACASEECLADFHEDLFLCQVEYRAEYDERVERGRKRMREFRAVLCGVCHNARPLLPRTAARAERLAAMFRESYIVLCDCQSSDSTVEFLRDWQKCNPRVDVITPSGAPPSRSQRGGSSPTESMALCRNAYRSHVLEHYADFDFVIVFDADLMGGWSLDGIAHTFSDDNWDMIGSYGLQRRRKRQRDEPPFAHCDKSAFRPRTQLSVAALDSNGELKLERGQPFLSVDSCFGGLAVYRLECLRLAEYGEADCEHVVFHNQLKLAGLDRIFLNPSQIVVHTPL